eukprot:NODE_4450_length_673_cov_269.462783.p1 GENE.NODE_4450_length_673_cov_269.462783~~NODE_4450_length_673_cov_269.462783.p1  ORF type:complete len:161 (-),score=49.81 NODE_4450_length_673_cov_269.462783:86-568(-)
MEKTEQTEKSYQKQDKNKGCGWKGYLSKGVKFRYCKKSIGLGFKIPRQAKEGLWVDKKCPFTADVSIRGRVLKGIVISTKMKRTIIVRRNYLHFLTKYQRFEKRHTNIAAHCSPAFDVKEGDTVTIGQCRPLAKTVRFNVLNCEHAKLLTSTPRKIFRIF